MAVVDPVADMLTRIRNAYGAYHKDVAVPTSKMKASIAGILKEEGYITDYAYHWSEKGQQARSPRICWCF